VIQEVSDTIVIQQEFIRHWNALTAGGTSLHGLMHVSFPRARWRSRTSVVESAQWPFWHKSFHSRGLDHTASNKYI